MTRKLLLLYLCCCAFFASLLGSVLHRVLVIRSMKIKFIDLRCGSSEAGVLLSHVQLLLTCD